MPGGLLQLAAYGAQNQYLNSNPQFTFFKSVYRRYTNFSMEFIRLNHEGPNELSVDVSSKITFKVQRNGDLISQLYFIFNLPDIYSHYDPTTKIPYKFHWIKNIGTEILNSVSITIGGQQIDIQYGEWLTIWNELTLSNDKKHGYNEMTANLMEYYAPEDVEGTLGIYPTSTLDQNLDLDPESLIANDFNPYLRPPSISSRQVYVPLNFWFCRNTGLALPLIALQYQEVQINIELRPIIDLYTIIETDQDNPNYLQRVKPNPLRNDQNIANFTVSGGTEDNTTINRQQAGSIDTDVEINFKGWGFQPYLDCNYIFLDKEERTKFAQISHEYLIEQTFRQDFKGIIGNKILELNLNRLSKQIIWVTKRNDIAARNDWNNYTNWLDQNQNPSSTVYKNYFTADQLQEIASSFIPTRSTNKYFQKNILREARLLFNGMERQNWRNSTFYNYLQPYQHSKCIPKTGIYLYSFSHELEKYQPSGACNMSRIKRIQLDISTNDIIPKISENENLQYQYLFDVTVYTVNYNVLRIMAGMAGTAFNN
tara:strand:- start:1191 stop:2807 length:1617 start_codon:yes stop_codon:yes gene_type:complete